MTKLPGTQNWLALRGPDSGYWYGVKAQFLLPTCGENGAQTAFPRGHPQAVF